MDTMWIDTLLRLDSRGQVLESRAGKSAEILGFSAKMESVSNNFLFNEVRNLSPYYACAEFLWYLSMTDDTSFLQIFAPGYKRFCEDGIHAFGAYGQRWGYYQGLYPNQIDAVIEVLKAHPESRQAVVTMWNSDDLPHAVLVDKKDLPCTLSLQFLLRNGYLHLVATMRSNDVWLGLPYDVFCFTQLQNLIADIIGSSVGSYTHNAGSMHYYEKDFEKINKILNLTKKELAVDSPDSEHRAGTTSQSLSAQVDDVINFVYSVKAGEGDPSGIDSYHSVIADAAFVCASKFDKKYVKQIFDPQLRMAVEVQHGKE